jgi:WD40 repeat protein
MTTAPMLSDDVIRFPSLESMRTAHTELLKAFRAEGLIEEMIARIEAFIARGRSTGALLDVEAERWSAQSQLDYWSTQLYRPGYPTPNSTLEEFDPELAPELRDELCPYVGLDAFREGNQAIFFGRDHLVSELIEKIRSVRFLAVLGSSGSGKSSVVRAGLIPRLKNDGLPGSVQWIYLKPMVPGSNPLLNLAHLMEPDAELLDQASIADAYRKNPGRLAQAVSEEFGEAVVLVVDQFEEIFTLCTDDDARLRFVESLIYLSQMPGAEHRVIVTMRSDFETKVARLPELQKLIEQSAVRVTPLSAGELREAIESPAAGIGLKFEDGVVDALLNDTLGEPAALPLLQFTLLKLWENRERNRITWEAYKRLGGGREALARSADDFYNNLIHEEQVTMRRILLKMVRPGEGLEVTSNRVPRRALYQKAEANDRINRVLDRLIAARLVRISEGDMAGDEQVEVAHEALVRNWPRLVEWLEEERATLRQRQRLTTAAEEWQRLGRDTLALWRGLLLEEARHYDDLNSLETEFLAAGYEAERAEAERAENEARQQRELEMAQALAETERQRAEEEAARAEEQARYARNLRRQSRRLTAALVVAVLLGLAAGLFAYLSFQATNQAQANEADAIEQKAEALRQRQVADANAVLAKTNQETADKNAVEANKQRLLAEAQRSAARAQIYQARTGGLYASTLLALDSWRRAPSDEAAEILRENISLLPIPLAQSNQHAKITALELDARSSRFLTASADGKVCVRKMQDGQAQFCVTSSGAVEHAIFVLDGTSIAIGDEKGVVQIIDAETGELQKRLEYKSAIRGLDFSEVNKAFAVAREDGNIDVMILQSPQSMPIDALLKITGKISVASLSPDGRSYAAGTAAGSIIIWNLANSQIMSHREDRRAVLSLRFSPNGHFLVSGGADNRAVVFDIRTGKPIFQSFQGDDWVQDIAFFPDGNSFATASNDSRVQVWDLATGKENMVMFTDAAVTSLKVSPDGKWIVATGENGTIRVWSASTGVEQLEIPLGNAGTVLAISNDSQRLFSGDVNGDMGIWDISGISSPSSHIQFDETLRIVKFDASGSRLIASDANRVWFLNPSDVSEAGASSPKKAVLELNEAIDNLAISPDGKLMGISTFENKVYVYDLVTRKPIFVVQSPGDVSALAFSADSFRIIIGTVDGTLETRDIQTAALIVGLHLDDPILSISWGQNGIAVGIKDKIIVLNPETESRIVELDAPGENQFLALNTDNSLLISANSSGQIRFWRQKHNSYTLQITLTRERPYSMDFNSSSNLLVVGSLNKIFLIDASSGQEIGRIPHKGNVTNVSFSPDGTTLATAYLRTLQLWDVSRLQNIKTDDLARAACSRLVSNLSRSLWRAMFGNNQPYVTLCEGLPVPE